MLLPGGQRKSIKFSRPGACVLLAAFYTAGYRSHSYGGQHAQVALRSAGVVIADAVLDRLVKFVFAGKTSATAAFPL